MRLRKTRTPIAEHRQVRHPGAHGLGVDLPHDPRDLTQVTEIMRDPGREQLSEGDRAELGMASASAEVSRGQPERSQPSEVGLPKRLERVEQHVERFSTRGLELRKAVERGERARLASGEDDLKPRHPVGPLTMDQVADNVERRPGVGTLGGPREAVWHGIIRKNHGSTHFIVGRDHAGPGNDANGKPFYGPYEAQELFKKHEADIGVTMVPFNMMVYLEDQDKYIPDNEVRNGARVLNISGTQLRQRLNEGREIPGWFTYTEVAHELRRSYPPRHKQGLTIFFTGLSGSGKSTIANVLMTKFLEMGGRPVTLLDGDLVRKHLSSELGFSKEHRDINIRRIGYVASEITKNGGIAICAPIAPYDAVRKHVREMIEPFGGFVLVHVATPVEVCEQRDRKGSMPRRGQESSRSLPGFLIPTRYLQMRKW